MRWQLPDYIQDVLPPEAEHIEVLRRRLLDLFRSYGYQMVMPPLVEYLDSLTIGAGADLALRTCQVVDQLSGRTLGVRPDMTPQVTRIDAQLLNRSGVCRLCYCGSVVHTVPSALTEHRQPLQLGVELYGHAGIEADIEVIRLLQQTLHTAGLLHYRIDIGHVGLFRALAQYAGANEAQEQELFALVLSKNIPDLNAYVAQQGLAERAEGLCLLPDLYGDANVLERAAAQLPSIGEVHKSLNDLRELARHLGDLPIGFDLSDLRGYHYQRGIMFAAYAEGVAAALGMGGRYDQVGEAYGRGRPATGLSVDLKRLVLHAVHQSSPAGAILVPWCTEGSGALPDEINRLRQAGETVVYALPGHSTASWREAGCNRRLVLRESNWIVEPLQAEEE